MKIDLDGSDEIIITKRQKGRIRMPEYSCIGLKYQKVIIGGLGKPARDMLSILVNVRDLNTNMAEYRVKGINAKSQLTKAYAELKNQDLVIRTRRQHYFINPSAFYPRSFSMYPELKRQWDNIKKGIKDA